MMTFVHQVAYAINNGIDKLEAAAALGFIGIMGSGGKFPIDNFITHSGSETKTEPAAAMTAGDMRCPVFSNQNPKHLYSSSKYVRTHIL